MKKFLVTFAIALAAFATNGIFGVITPASAEQIYASTSDGIDWYVESDEVSGTRSGLTYAGVYASSGDHVNYCFSNYKGWEYQFWRDGMQASSWMPLSRSKLANDILYVALNIKASKR